MTRPSPSADTPAAAVAATTILEPRLFGGPALDGRPESWRGHLDRLGPTPNCPPGALIDGLEASGLLGRGGGAFPVGRKWRTIAERPGGRAVVVANGAEGEPASFKDRFLMAHRPHLVLEGAALAAEAIEADEIVLYIGEEHGAAIAAMRTALGERGPGLGRAARIVLAPRSYIAGEASAAVHAIDTGDARPTTRPPRISEQGVAGRPTLVQNVETLAHVALIARFGPDWYRLAGRGICRGTALVTVNGAAGPAVVDEIGLGTPVGDLADRHGIDLADTGAVLLGGYFGRWAPAADAWRLPLDPVVLGHHDLTFGCGMIGFLPASRCGLVATASVMGVLADSSAAQCGPCWYGLRSIGEALGRLAAGDPRADDLARLERLAVDTKGRGACHHPDGAAGLLTSALDVFADEVRFHARAGACSSAALEAGARA